MSIRINSYNPQSNRTMIPQAGAEKAIQSLIKTGFTRRKIMVSRDRHGCRGRAIDRRCKTCGASRQR